MQCSTDDVRDCATAWTARQPRCPDRCAAPRRPEAPEPGHRGGGRRLDRATSRLTATTRAGSKSSATATCPSEPSSPVWGRSRSKQPRVHDRRPAQERREVLLADFAAVPAQDQEHRGTDSLAVPQGHQHAAISTRPWRRCSGRSAKGLSATTITRLKSIWQEEYQAWSQRSLGGQAVRVRVGRRHALQHSPGRGSAMHSGADGRHAGRHQGGDRHQRRLSRDRSSRGGRCCWMSKHAAW